METLNDTDILTQIAMFLYELFDLISAYAYVGTLLCIVVAVVLWFRFKHKYTLVISIVGIVFLLLWLSTSPFDRMFVIGF